MRLRDQAAGQRVVNGGHGSLGAGQVELAQAPLEQLAAAGDERRQPLVLAEKRSAGRDRRATQRARVPASIAFGEKLLSCRRSRRQARTRPSSEMVLLLGFERGIARRHASHAGTGIAMAVGTGLLGCSGRACFESSLLS